jgi:hypothetical protein
MAFPWWFRHGAPSPDGRCKAALSSRRCSGRCCSAPALQQPRAFTPRRESEYDGHSPHGFPSAGGDHTQRHRHSRTFCQSQKRITGHCFFLGAFIQSRDWICFYPLGARFRITFQNGACKSSGLTTMAIFHKCSGLASELRLERIEFSGALLGAQKWQAYRDADLFVLPTYSENFGMSVAEALAAGTPAIVTKGAPWSRLDTRSRPAGGSTSALIRWWLVWKTHCGPLYRSDGNGPCAEDAGWKRSIPGRMWVSRWLTLIAGYSRDKAPTQGRTGFCWTEFMWGRNKC